MILPTILFFGTIKFSQRANLTDLTHIIAIFRNFQRQTANEWSVDVSVLSKNSPILSTEFNFTIC